VLNLDIIIDKLLARLFHIKWPVEIIKRKLRWGKDEVMVLG